MKKSILALLVLFLLANIPLGGLAAGENPAHTLVIGTDSPGMPDPRLEHFFLSKYPDGKIVYVDYRDPQNISLLLLEGQMPDISLVRTYAIRHYFDLGVIENLYESVFPEGYPAALAEEARHLMELEGSMIGVASNCVLSGWSMNETQGRRYGFSLPEKGWSWQDFMGQYFQPFLEATEGMEKYYHLIQGAGWLDENGNYALPNIVGEGVTMSLQRHYGDPQYVLTDAFRTQLEYCKRVSTSGACVSGFTEDGPEEGMIISTVFEPFGTIAWPYRSGDQGRAKDGTTPIPAPAVEENDPGISAAAAYYCLMREAPHRDFAVEVMRLLGSEEFQRYYTTPDRCFGAEEPSIRVRFRGEAWSQVAFSSEYHAWVRTVDASQANTYVVNEMKAPQPQKYQEHLRWLAETDIISYDSYALNELFTYVLIPALKEYFQDKITAEEVAQVLYQRMKMAVYE